MAGPDETRRTAADGFEGSIAGLGLSDVIQLKVQSRFSGCIAVQNGQARGLIFFRDSEIVHAEQGGKTGEDAFCDILEWPNGRFSLQPNVSTTRSTIQKKWQHLLLDAHRILDERRAGRSRQPPPVPQEAGGKPATPSELIEPLRAIPRVVYAMLQRRDGTRVGDDSYEAEDLAGQATYLAMIASQLGTVLQATEIVSATVQGSNRHLLLFANKTHYLSVLVSGDSQIGAVVAEVRRTLARDR